MKTETEETLKEYTKEGLICKYIRLQTYCLALKDELENLKRIDRNTVRSRNWPNPGESRQSIMGGGL